MDEPAGGPSHLRHAIRPQIPLTLVDYPTWMDPLTQGIELFRGHLYRSLAVGGVIVLTQSYPEGTYIVATLTMLKSREGLVTHNTSTCAFIKKSDK